MANVQGMTVAFSTSFLARATDFNWSGWERGWNDITLLSTTGGRLKEPSGIYDSGTIVCELDWDPEVDPVAVMGATGETVTVTFADPAPASTLSVSGFLRAFEIAGELGGRTKATATIECSGSITHG